jgi:hypothetical protein
MLNLARGAIISIALVLVCWWALQGSQTFKTCIQQDPKQTSENQPENYFSTFVTRADLYRDCLGDFVHDRKDEILVAFTVILAFSTIFLWVATRDLVSSAEKNTRSQLRAYISVVNGDIGIVNGEGGTIGVRAQIKIKNFGQTPAHKSVAWAVVRVLDAENTDFSMKKGDRPPSWTVMGPGAETIVARLVAIGQNDLAAIHDGTKRIFVWGRVEYIDAFDRKRWFVFHHRNSTAPETPARWGIEPYGEGEQGN